MCFAKGNGWATAGIILYLFGMLMSYVASTVYHSLSAWSKWKERLRKWDHAAIYWHIAGSYSPITLVALRQEGYWGWALFLFIWISAIAGTIVSFCKDRMFCADGSLCACSFWSIASLCKCRLSGVDHRGGCCLHHWGGLLQSQQAQIHAHGVPFLCSCGLHLPHHSRVGHAY